MGFPDNLIFECSVCGEEVEVEFQTEDKDGNYHFIVIPCSRCINEAEEGAHYRGMQVGRNHGLVQGRQQGREEGQRNGFNDGLEAGRRESRHGRW